MTGSPVWHPFTQHGLAEDIPLIARAQGVVLHGADGREWIDAISSWWVTTHGHANPRIMAAIAKQTERLDQIIFAGWTHEPAETLARGLVAITPEPLTKVFFSDSGSTAVEVALKMALGYWHNREKGGRKQARHKIIVMEHSYHGDTIGAMSVGARGVFNRPYAPLLFDVTSIPFPASGAEQAMLDALEAACRANAAAFIVEPLVLGAGGMLMYSPVLLAQMAAICAVHNVLFIADEVMTGWGRTGTLLACDQAGVVPDILCLSKGLTGGSVPLAVTLAREKIYAAHVSQDRADCFFHSSSYTANPIACAAANANLDIWADGPVQARIDALAALQAAELHAMAGHPLVASIRQCGTIAAFDIAAGANGYLSSWAVHLAAWGRANGVLIRPLGNTVYVMPPYCITAEQLRDIYAVVRAGMDAATE